MDKTKEVAVIRYEVDKEARVYINEQAKLDKRVGLEQAMVDGVPKILRSEQDTFGDVIRRGVAGFFSWIVGKMQGLAQSIVDQVDPESSSDEEQEEEEQEVIWSLDPNRAERIKELAELGDS